MFPLFVQIHYTARLPLHETLEVGRQERLLEIWTHQQEYKWQEQADLPSILKSGNIKDLPLNEQMQMAQYDSLPWELYEYPG